MPAYKGLRCVTFQSALRACWANLSALSEPQPKPLTNGMAPRSCTPCERTRSNAPVGLGMDCDRSLDQARIGRERDQRKLCVSCEKPVEA